MGYHEAVDALQIISMLEMHRYLTDNSTLTEMMEQQQKCCKQWRRHEETNRSYSMVMPCHAKIFLQIPPASAKTSNLVNAMLIYVITPQDLIHNIHQYSTMR